MGTDHIDLAYCREANIQVMTCTNCNTESVAEHALSLYFATRRSLVSVHNTLADFGPGRPNEWKSKGKCIGQKGAVLPSRTDEFGGAAGEGGGSARSSGNRVESLSQIHCAYNLHEKKLGNTIR